MTINPKGNCQETIDMDKTGKGRSFLAEAIGQRAWWRHHGEATSDHSICHFVGQRDGLDFQVEKHGVGFPPTIELTNVFVNASTEEGHGATAPEGTAVDLSRLEPTGWSKVASGGTEDSGNGGSGDLVASG